MGAPKPCHGYRSRSAAVHALRADGYSTEAIAAKLGIERKTITALESYRKSGRSRASGEPGFRTKQRRPIGADGLFSGEREILRLWDSGYSKDSICNSTGLAPSYVNNVISRLDVKAEGAWEAMVRRGTADLLNALRRAHPERFAREMRAPA